MTETELAQLRQELDSLRAQNATLTRKVSSLADANAHAAELLAALEEANEREQKLVRRGEELDLQKRLDIVLQVERDENVLLKRVAAELQKTESLGLRSVEILLDSLDQPEEIRKAIAAIPLDVAPCSVNDRTLDVPLHNAEKLVGALRLKVGEATDERWCSRWIRFLWSVGSQVGLALLRLRIERENERMNAELIIARDEALEANRIKSAFLANMSHELRTPMNAIIGYSEMLIEEADDLQPADFVADLQKIQTAGKHLLALINDVLDLSKIEAGKMTVFLEPFAIRAAIDEVVTTLQPLVTRNRNHLIVNCPAEIGTMVGDLVKFRQSLFNLLSNACKFTEVGTITLTVTTTRIEGIEFLEFAVTDTGIGMTPQQIGNLFQAFVQADSSATRKYGGTGLGLTISRKFCNMLGGDIRVASEQGNGSTFTIELPRFCQSGDSARPGQRAAEPFRASEKGGVITSDGRATVLAIEDNPEALELIARFLAKEGYHVLTASSGDAGLAQARMHRPDVITLDVMMPHMNGWQVLAALKADPQVASIPVILLSVVENKEIGMALGATDCMTKPIDWGRLDGLLCRLTAPTKTSPAPDTILVVEDDPDSSELVRRLLERDGWCVLTARDGVEALDKVRKQPPALIVLDLMMPVMDGFSFTEKLRSIPEYADIPIVVLTCKTLTPQEYRRLNSRVEEVLTKGGYDRSELLAMIRRLARPTMAVEHQGPTATPHH